MLVEAARSLLSISQHRSPPKPGHTSGPGEFRDVQQGPSPATKPYTLHFRVQGFRTLSFPVQKLKASALYFQASGPRALGNDIWSAHKMTELACST